MKGTWNFSTIFETFSESIFFFSKLKKKFPKEKKNRITFVDIKRQKKKNLIHYIMNFAHQNSEKFLSFHFLHRVTLNLF